MNRRVASAPEQWLAGAACLPLFFKGGQELEDLRLIGVQSRAAYQEAVDKVIDG